MKCYQARALKTKKAIGQQAFSSRLPGIHLRDEDIGPGAPRRPHQPPTQAPADAQKVNKMPPG